MEGTLGALLTAWLTSGIRVGSSLVPDKIASERLTFGYFKKNLIDYCVALGHETT